MTARITHVYVPGVGLLKAVKPAKGQLSMFGDVQVHGHTRVTASGQPVQVTPYHERHKIAAPAIDSVRSERTMPVVSESGQKPETVRTQDVKVGKEQAMGGEIYADNERSIVFDPYYRFGGVGDPQPAILFRRKSDGKVTAIAADFPDPSDEFPTYTKINAAVFRKMGKDIADYAWIGTAVPKKVLPDLLKVREQVRSQSQAADEVVAKNVPGIEEVRDAVDAAMNEDHRHNRQFNQMMDDEGNDGARPPRPINEALWAKAHALQEKYPRAALYVQAEDQRDSGSWADNTGKSAAADTCIKMLESGEGIEACEQALKHRRETTD